MIVFVDCAEMLIAELQRKRRQPTHVYFSPSTDVFQPVAEVLEMAYQMFAGDGVLEAEVFAWRALPFRDSRVRRSSTGMGNFLMSVTP
ncbi:MAG: hypothetical protein IT365_17115 [Candidatus Hydrogenedentes bacterium]|nr:hypothetical protein [Candidatus Hydrogenedentota bacterium]